MKSSTNNCSTNRIISDQTNKVSVPDSRIEPGMIFNKDRIQVALPYNRYDPDLFQAFSGNEPMKITINSLGKFNFIVLRVTSEMGYEFPFDMNILPLHHWPDISQRGPDFEMRFDVCWVDSETHTLLKRKFGRLSPEVTEDLCLMLENRMKDRISFSIEESPYKDLETV